MKSLILLLAASACLLCGEAWACGPDWTHIGGPPYTPDCIESMGPDHNRLVAGTWHDWGNPLSGGIYSCAGHDSNWEYLALQGQTIWRMRTFDYVAGSTFVCADSGLYVSHDDGYNWTLLTRVGANGIPWRHQEDFAISPFDTNQWVISYNVEGVGGFYLSRDHGTSWVLYYGGYVLGDLAFSFHFPGTLYFIEGGPLERAQFADSSFSTVMRLPNNQSVMSIAPHPLQPWIYAVAQSTGLYRYDETGGDTIGLALPPGISHPRTARFTDGEGVLVSTDQDLLLAGEDVQSWQSMGDGLPQPRGCDLLTASHRVWVIALVSGLYCRTRPLAVDPGRAASKRSTVNVYPNPARDQITLRLGQPATVKVFNVLGETMYSCYARDPVPQVTVSTTAFASGTYFYHATFVLHNRPPLAGHFQIIK